MKPKFFAILLGGLVFAVPAQAEVRTVHCDIPALDGKAELESNVEVLKLDIGADSVEATFLGQKDPALFKGAEHVNRLRTYEANPSPADPLHLIHSWKARDGGHVDNSLWFDRQEKILKLRRSTVSGLAGLQFRTLELRGSEAHGFDSFMGLGNVLKMKNCRWQ